MSTEDKPIVVEFLQAETINMEGGVHPDHSNITTADIDDFFSVTHGYARDYSISPRDGTVTIK